MYTLSSSRKPSGRFYGFRRRHHPTLQHGFRHWLFYGFRRGKERFLMVSVVVFLFYGFRHGRKTLFHGFRRWILGGFCRRRRIHNFIMYRAIPRFVCVFRTGFRRWFFMVSVLAGKHCLWFPSLGLFMVSVVARNVVLYGFRRCFFCFMASGCYRTATVSPMETVNKNNQDVSVTN